MSASKRTEELRKLAINYLGREGIVMSKSASIDAVCLMLEKKTGKARRPRQLRSDYVKSWIDSTGAKLNPPYKREFKPMDARTLRHPRLADINAAQPPLITPRGIGNTNQSSAYQPMIWRR